MALAVIASVGSSIDTSRSVPSGVGCPCGRLPAVAVGVAWGLGCCSCPLLRRYADRPSFAPDYVSSLLWSPFPVTNSALGGVSVRPLIFAAASCRFIDVFFPVNRSRGLMSALSKITPFNLFARQIAIFRDTVLLSSPFAASTSVIPFRLCSARVLSACDSSVNLFPLRVLRSV